MRITSLTRSLTIRSVILFALALLAALTFAGIAEEMVEGEADALDLSVATRVHAAASPTLDAVMIFITYLGSTWVIAPVVALTAAYAWRRGHHRLAWILGAGWALAEALNAALKLMFERPRPDVFQAIAAPWTPSFPSGHAMRALAVYGAVAAILCELHPRLARVVIPAATVLVLAIGLSRVYLGVHWPSDVVAGYAVGAIALAVTVHLTHQAERT